MRRLRATIKIPMAMTEIFLEQLYALGCDTVSVEIIPREQFVRESRLNYDCVFPQLWEDPEAAYLRFYFDDSNEGRKKSFHVEYNLMQIPLNLRYEEGA